MYLTESVYGINTSELKIKQHNYGKACMRLESHGMQILQSSNLLFPM